VISMPRREATPSRRGRTGDKTPRGLTDGVDKIENWLAQYVCRCSGLPVPESSPVRIDPAISNRSRSVARRRNHGENALAKTKSRLVVSGGVHRDDLTPRVYTDIGDCLNHKGAIVQQNRRVAAEATQSQDKQRTQASMSKVVSKNSREIVNKMKMRRVVELYDILDPMKAGHIDLSDLDYTMQALSPGEIDFLGPLLSDYADEWNTDSMAMEEFVSQMVVVMRNKDCTWGPLSALSARRSCKRSQRTEIELEEDRQAKLTFKPAISDKSHNLVETQRVNRGMHTMSQQQRLTLLSNERAMWGQRREALERKQEAEEMSQCTFTPNINPARFCHTKAGGKPTYMKPLKAVTNMLSSEEREVLKHCTFTPDTSLSKSIRRPGSAVRTRPLSARKQKQTPSRAHRPPQPSPMRRTTPIR